VNVCVCVVCHASLPLPHNVAQGEVGSVVEMGAWTTLTLE
jgi:hypothetical protein